MHLLGIQPKLWSLLEKCSKCDCRLRADVSTLMDDLMQTGYRQLRRASDSMYGQFHALNLFQQQHAGMHGNPFFWN